jgi:DNA repair ATPase RecN
VSTSIRRETEGCRLFRNVFEILARSPTLGRLSELVQSAGIRWLSLASLRRFDFWTAYWSSIGIITLLNTITALGGILTTFSSASSLRYVYSTLAAIILEGAILSIAFVLARELANTSQTDDDDSNTLSENKWRIALLFAPLTILAIASIIFSYVDVFARTHPNPLIADSRTTMIGTQRDLIKLINEDVRRARDDYLNNILRNADVVSWLNAIAERSASAEQLLPDFEQRLRLSVPALASQLTDVGKQIDASQAERMAAAARLSGQVDELQKLQEERSILQARCTEIKSKQPTCPDEQQKLDANAARQSEVSKDLNSGKSRLDALDERLGSLRSTQTDLNGKLQILNSTTSKNLADRLSALSQSRNAFAEDPSLNGYRTLVQACEALSNLLSIDPQSKGERRCDSSSALKAVSRRPEQGSFVRQFAEKCPDERLFAGAIDLDDLYSRLDDNLVYCISVAKQAGTLTNQGAIRRKLFDVYPSDPVQRAFVALSVGIGSAQIVFLNSTGTHIVVLLIVLVGGIRRARMLTRNAVDQSFLPPLRTIDRSGDERTIQMGPIAIERLEIDNFRNLQSISIVFDQTSSLPGNWTCIAGINGSGKSTILQALSIVLLGEKYAAELGGELLKRLIRRDSEVPRARVSATCKVGRNTYTLEIPLNASGIDEEALHGHPDYWLMRAVWFSMQNQVFVSYGATRNISERRDTRYAALSRVVQRQMTLYDPLTQVAGSDILLMSESDRDKKAAATFGLLIRKVLKEQEVELSSRSVDRRFGFFAGGVALTALDLPDGYRSTAAWLADLCVAWHESAPAGTTRSTNPEDISGIVLLDELDLHLHVSLQREIVPRLRAALPRVQFVVTTHSPMILSCFDRHELVVLDRAVDGGVRSLDRQLFGLSMDEIFEYLMGTKPLSPIFSEIAARDRSQATKLAYQSLDRSEADAESELKRREAVLRRLSSQQ